MSDNSIIIEGEEIPVDETISMEYYSPFVDNNEVVIGSNSINPRGKFSLPTKIKGNKELNRALGFLNLPSIASRNYTVGNARLKSRGVMLDQGYLKVNMAATNLNTGVSDYDVIAVFESSIIATLLKDKKVNDLAMSGIKQIPKNPVGANLYPFENYKSKSNLVIYRSMDPYNPTDWDVNAIRTFHWMYHWDEIENGATAFPSWFTTNPYPKEALLATSIWVEEVLNGDHDADYICFPSFKAMRNDNPIICNFWEWDANRLPTFHVDDVQGWILKDGPTGGYLEIMSNISRKDHPLVPCYFYHQVLKHCFSEFGYNLLPNELIDSEHFKRLFLLNTFAINKESKLIFFDERNEDPVTPFFIQEDTEVNPKNHLPDIPILDFLRDFMTRFCAHFSFNGKDVTIVFNDLEKIQREIKDYNPYVEFEAVKNVGLLLEYDKSSDDVYDETEFFDSVLPFGSGDKQIELKIPPCANDDTTFEFYSANPGRTYSYISNAFVMPADLPVTLNQVSGHTISSYVYKANGVTVYGVDPVSGNNKDYALFNYVDCDEPDVMPNKSIFSPLAFYYGFRPYLLSNPSLFVYPFASWRNYHTTAPFTNLGDFHLGLNGPDGIVKTFWRLFEKLYAAGEVTKIRADEALDIINNHKFNQCVLWRGQMLYIAGIQFDLPLTEMPKYDCYRIQ